MNNSTSKTVSGRKPTLRLLASGTIFANPYPADWPVHAYYPNIAVLPDGELLCVCRLGAAMYADDGRIVPFRSRDNGETWHRESAVWDGRLDSQAYWYAPAGITRIPGGDLLITAMRIHRPSPDTPTCNDETGACLPEETVLFRSADGGRNWSHPLLIRKPEGVYLEAYGAVVPLNDGRWLQVFDVTKAYDDPAPTRPRVVGLLSGDQGATWSSPVSIVGGPDSGKTFWHMRPIGLRDGRVLAFPWTGDDTGQNFLPLHRVEGDAGASAWSQPHSTQLPGQTNCVVDIGGGVIGIVYTVRGGDRPGTWVALSHDEGYTFDLEGQVQVWDAYGRESLGVPRTDTYPSSHDNIAFGAPNLVQLADGHLLASFWATVAGQAVCRWARLGL